MEKLEVRNEKEIEIRDKGLDNVDEKNDELDSE